MMESPGAIETAVCCPTSYLFLQFADEMETVGLCASGDSHTKIVCLTVFRNRTLYNSMYTKNKKRCPYLERRRGILD